MACESIYREELLKLIYTLNNNKSPGPDNFGPILVKEMASQIIEPLLYIYNLSFSTGVVPDKMLKTYQFKTQCKGDSHNSVVSMPSQHHLSTAPVLCP